MNTKQAVLCPECKMEMKQTVVQIVSTSTQSSTGKLPIVKSNKFISYVCIQYGRMQSIAEIK